MAKVILFSLLSVLACVSAQRITTIHLDGVQYFISRMNPYSPELNYFLAYQYCRSLGLQLASFETKEKSESMTTYLKNAGYGNYDFWTSGNRLGTGMFLWMSTGLPFNATFDFFENSGDALQTSLLDANDHNSNTAPQRTARDSSGSEKGCVILKQPSLKWMPEDCSAVKDFICEQTRCYYYNYGSIPVSSAQGRPITSTTPQPKQQPTVTEITLRNTTPLPILMSTYAYEKKLAAINNNNLPQQQQQQQQQPPQQQQDQQHHAKKEIDIEEDESQPSFMSLNLDHEGKKLNQEHEQAFGGEVDADGEDETVVEDEEHDDNVAEESDEMTAHIVGQDHEQEKARELKKNHEHKISADDTIATGLNSEHQQNQEQLANHAEEVEEEKNSAKMDASKLSAIDNNIKSHEVDEHVAQISHKIEKIVSNEQMYPLHHHAHAHFHRQDSNNESNNHDNNSNDDDVNDGNDDDSSRQSFLSLTDLIRTLRPNDKQIIPQIDSDYSNAMRVLGENTGPLMKRDEQQPRGNNNFRDNLDFSTH